MGRALSQLIDDIELEKIELNIFRGKAIDVAKGRTYGGQVLAQAMNAAGATVATPLVLHSMHAYFLREGDDDTPIVYEVDRIRDGRTFTTRRVVAIQHGRAIFNASLSYQLPEEGIVEHASTMPAVAGPEKLMSDEVFYAETLGQPLQKAWPIEFRQVEPVNPKQLDEKDACSHIWFKSSGDLADDLALHQELLAYASDHLLLDTALKPHAKTALDESVKMASLDHSIWFHRPFRIDEWLLYETESHNAFGTRAFVKGKIYNRDGQLVASSAQEGVIRAS